MMSNAAKCFDILAINFVILSNYFDVPARLFFRLYLVKFLDSSAKLLFQKLRLGKLLFCIVTCYTLFIEKILLNYYLLLFDFIFTHYK